MSRERTGHCRDLLKCVKSMGQMTHMEEAGRIILGNNLDYMDHICKNDKLGRGLQLIYVDPPFFSKSKYQASVVLQSEILGNSSTVKIDAYDDFRASALESVSADADDPAFFHARSAVGYRMYRSAPGLACCTLCEDPHG